MLSYRHAFHAGNHADVLKHYVLFEVLSYFRKKDKPFWYIDTHSGAGLYRLDSLEAQKITEFEYGINRLYQSHQLGESLEQFKKHICSIMPNMDTQCYPGSPWLAQSLINTTDYLRFYELHPKDYQTLKLNMQHSPHAKRVRCFQQDGFQGILALLPPSPRRAVVLIDPPYENKHDYQQVIESVLAAYKKFPQGCYLIWYPCINSQHHTRKLVNQLESLFTDNFLRAELWVKQPQVNHFGMYGSGMFIINPSYTLPKILSSTLPELTTLLAQDKYAHHQLNYQIR